VTAAAPLGAAPHDTDWNRTTSGFVPTVERMIRRISQPCAGFIIMSLFINKDSESTLTARPNAEH
jgi:hypothetical protein